MEKISQNMNNIGLFIVKTQNEEYSLRCLAAMNKIYSEAKILFGCQILLTTGIVVFLSLINMFYPIESLLVIYCILITIADSVLINDLIMKKKKIASSIQEIFDTKVLQLEWNNLIDTVDYEIIYRYSEKSKKKQSLENFANWYSTEIQEVPGDAAKIICQYSNCRYDLSLRKNFSNYLYSLLAVSSALIFSFALIKDLTLEKVFIIILFPLLPIIVFCIEKIKENNRSMVSLERMKERSKMVWKETIENKSLNLLKAARQIQDTIYQNRINSPLIFDWFYNYSRTNLEKEMNYSVKQLVAEYQGHE